MFTGAIPRPMRDALLRYKGAVDGKPCWVLCSGAFTVEYLLCRHMKPSALRSCDVSLYSSVLGALFSGRDMPLGAADGCGWLRPYLGSILDKAAAVSCCLEMAPFARRKNDHEMRLWAEHSLQFPANFEATKGRLAARATVVHTEYHPRDAAELLGEIPPGDVVLSFPPTYAGGYERLYRDLDSMFEWDRPTYKVFDGAAYAEFMRRIFARPGPWFVTTDRGLGQMTPLAEVRTSLKPVLLYSNVSGTPYWWDSDLSQPPPWPGFRLLPFDHEFSAPPCVDVRPVSPKAFSFYRDACLRKVDRPVLPQVAAAVCTEAGVVGFAGWNPPRLAAAGGPDWGLYMLSDFAVPSARNLRLAKLVILALRSNAARAILEQQQAKPVSGWFTTAFTDKPVSMKYRGVAELAARKPGRLTYRAPMDLDVADVGRIWWEEHELKARGSR